MSLTLVGYTLNLLYVNEADYIKERQLYKGKTIAVVILVDCTEKLYLRDMSYVFF